MIVYRIVNSEYKDDLSGQGAFLYGGRWNHQGQYALYAAQHISLAVLEIVVNFNSALYKIKPQFHLLEIFIPPTEIIKIDASALKKSWVDDWGYTQYMGEQFLQQKNHLVLTMPSAVIPQEYNFMINPLHEDFKKVKIAGGVAYNLDSRLF